MRRLQPAPHARATRICCIFDAWSILKHGAIAYTMFEIRGFAGSPRMGRSRSRISSRVAPRALQPPLQLPHIRSSPCSNRPRISTKTHTVVVPMVPDNHV